MFGPSKEQIERVLKKYAVGGCGVCKIPDDIYKIVCCFYCEENYKKDSLVI